MSDSRGTPSTASEPAGSTGVQVPGGARWLARERDGCSSKLHDLSQLTFASYYDVVMPRWHAHRVAVLGDAAHATSPQLGQGCNLALCDAAATWPSRRRGRPEPTFVEQALLRSFHGGAPRAPGVLPARHAVADAVLPERHLALLDVVRDALMGPASDELWRS